MHFFNTVRYLCVCVFVVANNERKIDDYQLVEHFSSFNEYFFCSQCNCSHLFYIFRLSAPSKLINMICIQSEIQCNVQQYRIYITQSFPHHHHHQHWRRRSRCQVDRVQKKTEWKEQEQSLYILLKILCLFSENSYSIQELQQCTFNYNVKWKCRFYICQIDKALNP